MSTDLRLDQSHLEQFSSIIEAMPSSIVVVGPDGKIVMVNERLTALFGYSREELVGQVIEVLVPARLRLQHVGFRGDFLANPQARPMGSGRELFGRYRDGTEFPVEIDLSTIKGPAGFFILGSVVDISERKGTEAALLRNQQRVRLIVDAALDAIVSIDEWGKITEWNPQAETIFGWRNDEAVGQSMAELIVPARYREKHRQGLGHFVATGEGPGLNKRLELTALRRTGEEFPIELTIAPIQIGSRYEFCAFVRDITEHKRLEERLQATIQERTTVLKTQRRAALNLAQDADEAKKRAQRNEMALAQANKDLQCAIAVRQQTEEELCLKTTELARSNTELEQFAYIASHDLQEPLRKVRAFGDLLATKAGPALGEEERDYLQRMQGAAQRMESLITDLLAFARVTSDAKPFVPVDLARIAREVLSDLETRVKTTAGRVDIGDLPALDGDPLQMRQLLQNLIGNALKFHRPAVPPVILVQARVVPISSQEFCEITVADNGIGLEEKYADRIFFPFQRLHGRGEYEGTGMGLAICRKIAERHGGTITAHGALGRGTTFNVLLPMFHPK